MQINTKEQFESAKDADRILVPLSLWEEITPDERCFVLLPAGPGPEAAPESPEAVQKLFFSWDISPKIPLSVAQL